MCPMRECAPLSPKRTRLCTLHSVQSLVRPLTSARDCTLDLREISFIWLLRLHEFKRLYRK